MVRLQFFFVIWLTYGQVTECIKFPTKQQDNLNKVEVKSSTEFSDVKTDIEHELHVSVSCAH